MSTKLTVEDVGAIKAKVTKLKDTKSKAEGAMENISKRWKAEFSCPDRKAVKARIEELGEGVAENEKRLGTLLEKVEAAYDWSSVS